VGDHFVQRGIASLIRRVVPQAEFETFDVNNRGGDQIAFGLTVEAAERANRAADFVVVGGSNLYEGRDTLGIHVEPDFFKSLKVPLILLGIGTGSGFRSKPPRPSNAARDLLANLHRHAILAGARDVTTLQWLRQLGIEEACLIGDPATFIFNRTRQPAACGDHVVVTMPPIRFWNVTSRREYFDPRRRRMFQALSLETRRLKRLGYRIVITCNDASDMESAGTLFGRDAADAVHCPATPEEHFDLLKRAKVVISGRLHTAVVSFSLGIPFALVDVDQRTSGFIRTYELEDWAIVPSLNVGSSMSGIIDNLFDERFANRWEELIDSRNAMHSRALNLLSHALKAYCPSAR